MLRKLWELFTVWSSIPSSSLRGAQAILVHAAGENSPSDPGLVNKFMAGMVRWIFYKHRIPVIVQGEIAPFLKDIPLEAVSPRQAETAPHYMDTRDIALWQKEVCDRLGVRTVVLISYLPQYWRALRATEEIGLKVLVPAGLKEMYDPRNSQKWARSKWVNRPYELLARLHYLRKGWI